MIQDDLRKSVETFFGTGKIVEISKLEGGYWNQVFKLEAEKGDFVLRLCNPRTKAESVSFQHALLRFMHPRIAEVPLPVTGTGGATFFVRGRRVVSLLTFMPGEMASRKRPAHQISAAAMLGRLHAAALEYPENFGLPDAESLAQFDWETNSNWRWTEIKDLLVGGAEELKKRLVVPPFGESAQDCIEEIAARRTQIAAEREKAENWVTKLKSSKRPLVCAPAHGDYYPGNLLAIDDKISAVIDWDVCRREWLAYELARALWEFCRFDETPVMDSTNVEAFLRAYADAGGMVPETDFDLLIPFIRVVRIEEVLFSLGEALRGEWWEPEYTLFNLEALDNIESGNLFV
jgi:Ser/Thr protein kinase RdoA (MazF antagonist)